MVKLNFLRTPPLDVYTQMAADEILVAETKSTGEAYARIFNWGEAAQIKAPCATFGYAQYESLVKKQLDAQGIKTYTRRPTGGGIVVHNDDLTFSLVFPSPKNFKAPALYAGLHRAIKEELIKKGFKPSVYADKSDYRPAAGGKASGCFANPVTDDLLDENGAKVLGGALRKFADAVLYQGSLQLKGARRSEICAAAVKNACVNFFETDLVVEKAAQTPLLYNAYALAAKQYKQASWIKKF